MPDTISLPRTTHSTDTVLRRADRLLELNAARHHTTDRIRRIMNGGRDGLEALFGRRLDDLDEADRETLPYLNLAVRGVERFAHRLGRAPDLVVDAPDTTDSQRAHERAAKRVRVVESYDARDELAMRLPQIGRWLTGYGYAAMTVGDTTSVDGHGYPAATLWDSAQTHPGEWGHSQHPREVCFVAHHHPEELAGLYPNHAAAIMANVQRERSPGGGYLLTAAGGSGRGSGVNGGRWRTQTDGSLEVVTYTDLSGVYVVLPARKLLLSFVPNRLTIEPFVVFKRFSFDQLAGQFDHAIGLMASFAKFNILVQIAAQDDVFAPTNVYGFLPPGGYRIGRGEVNQLDAGTRVERPTLNLPYQTFQHVNSLLAQFRQASGYSEQMDGSSPTAWATGQGLEELNTGIDAEIAEYQLTLRFGLERLDRLRLEHDATYYPDETKPMAGVRKGAPFSETYKPATHIGKATRTRRAYGMMAGWDDARKIVSGLQLFQAGAISKQLFVENLSGIENVARELDRVRDEETAAMLRGIMQEQGTQGDQRAIMAMIGQLPDGEQKEIYRKFYTPEEPELSAEEAAMLEGPAPAPGAGLPVAPPDVTTVMAQLGAGGDADLGVRTIGTVA